MMDKIESAMSYWKFLLTIKCALFYIQRGVALLSSAQKNGEAAERVSLI
jgi:hypothetical protein